MKTCIKNICFLAILSLSFISCSGNKNKADVVDMVNDWMGRQIAFPENSVFTILGKDTVVYDFSEASYKILTYIDSKECLSCNLSFSSWKSLIAEMDTMLDVHVPVIFYFGTSHAAEIRHLAKSDDFDYPICIDRNDQLNALNRFPDSIDFHTFLLNKDNKIVAIGNPVNNARIKDLYMGTISGQRIVGETSTTTAVLSEEKIVLGTIPYAEEARFTFSIKNTGDNLLVIHEIRTSCGCTEVEYSKEPVPNGRNVEVTVVCKPDNRGTFNKTISIYSNGSTMPFVVSFSGKAE